MPLLEKEEKNVLNKNNFNHAKLKIPFTAVRTSPREQHEERPCKSHLSVKSGLNLCPICDLQELRWSTVNSTSQNPPAFTPGCKFFNKTYLCPLITPPWGGGAGLSLSSPTVQRMQSCFSLFFSASPAGKPPHNNFSVRLAADYYTALLPAEGLTRSKHVKSAPAA